MALQSWMLRLFAVIAFVSIASMVPALGWAIVALVLIPVVFWGFYEAEKLPRFIMDPLDRLTNKSRLEKQLADLERQAETLDAEELAAHLKSRVIGQDAVADDVARQIRRRMVARRPDKPIAVFCFAGPPGVGKTYFAKVLAEKLYGDAKYLQFFDMSQHAQAHSASALFGMAKGYVGSDTYGVLTRALQNNPRSVVLLDEFEKAHPEVRKRFLTAWNDGFVTEASDGSHISTAQTIFILTTNAAARTIGELARRYADDRDELIRATKTALKEEGGFEPEILSRIDQVFAFSPLQGLDVARVVALEIEKMVKQYGLELSGGGIDPNILLRAIERNRNLAAGGVRELSRAIEHEIADGVIDAKQAKAAAISLHDDGGQIRVAIDRRRQDNEPT